MRLKQLISTVIIMLTLANFAFADQSASYKIDVSEINDEGEISSSSNYKLNDTIIGLVSGETAASANYKLGSGLVYLEIFCGNNVVEQGEQCDDGNNTSGDGCSSACQIEAAICGNGTVETGEQCDDGNAVSGDGCSATCQTEAGGGGGGGYSYPSCGNGIKQSYEQCDDGNTVSGDGCSALCMIEKGFIEEIPEEAEEEVPEEAEEEVPEIPEEIFEIPEIELMPGYGVIRELKIYARPEKRVNPANNLKLSVYLRFYNKELKKVIAAYQVNINEKGWGILDANILPDGAYNISLKGLSHLTTVIRDFDIDSSSETLDFTHGEDFHLLAGDVHSGKDDFINGLDISAAVTNLYSSDLNADLNRDGTVNSLDLSMVITNLYKTGEKIAI